MADTTLLLEDQNYRQPKYVLASLGAWVGSLSMGTVLGYSSPALPSFDEPGSHIVLSDSLKSLFASLMALGAVFGSIFAGFAIETIGRKGTLLLSSIPFILGWILMAYAGDLDSKASLFIGRAITGFCCGIITLTAPVYIAETSDPQKRGFFGAGFQLTVTIGVVFTYIVGKYTNWADLALYVSVFPLMLLFIILWLPESPAWLLKKGKISEATEANLFLHGAEGSRRLAVDVSASAIQDDGFDSNNVNVIQQINFLYDPQCYRPLWISVAVMFFQQFCGVNAIIFFMTSIFLTSGFTKIDPADSSIIVAIIQVFATAVACWLSDRCGRKLLLLISSLGCFISLIPMIVYRFIVFYGTDKNVSQNFGWMSLLSIVSFIIFFSLGLGPIPWLLMGEILPFRVRSLATIVVSSFNWLCVFLIIVIFYQMKSYIGFTWFYVFFAIISLIGAIFTHFMIPETKGKSFQEIESLFA